MTGVWKFVQKSGYLYLDDVFKGSGYSGRGVGYLNPMTESIQDIGPIPSCGYTIGPWENYHTHLGVLVAPLTPTGPIFGRSGFFIHGDNVDMNHSASDGCIILSHFLRELVRDSGSTNLIVVPGSDKVATGDTFAVNK